MNPETGRFHSMDSFEGRMTDPLSLHKYMYAHANSVMWIDPGGQSIIYEVAATAAVAGILYTIHHSASYHLKFLDYVDPVTLIIYGPSGTGFEEWYLSKGHDGYANQYDHVIYATTLNEVITRMSIIASTGVEFDIVTFAGHGNKGFQSLGTGTDYLRRETIDKVPEMAQFMTDDATLVLLGCNTGQDMELIRDFSEAGDVNVVAYTGLGSFVPFFKWWFPVNNGDPVAVIR